MLRLQARLRRLLSMPVVPAEDRAELAAAIDSAQSMDDLAIVTGRMFNAGARELHKVADGVAQFDRVDAARIRAEADRYTVPELLEKAE